jgi:hypothetical protein
MLGLAYARAGRMGEARQILKEIEAANGADPRLPIYRAYLLGALGRQAEAYQAMKNAFDQRSKDFLLIALTPGRANLMDQILTDNRWPTLKRQVLAVAHFPPGTRIQP